MARKNGYKKRKRKRAEAQISLRSPSLMKSNKGRKTLGLCNICGKHRLFEVHTLIQTTISQI